LKLVIINRHTRSSSASSDEEEKRRPFLSTLTSSLMLQGENFDSNEKNNFFEFQKKSQTIFQGSILLTKSTKQHKQAVHSQTYPQPGTVKE